MSLSDHIPADDPKEKELIDLLKWIRRIVGLIIFLWVLKWFLPFLLICLFFFYTS